MEIVKGLLELIGGVAIFLVAAGSLIWLHGCDEFDKNG